MSDLITSPLGTIKFCALNRKVTKKPTDTEPTVYTLKLEFDGDDPKAQEFKASVESVNPGLIGTKHASKPGNFTVQASTKFTVDVYGQDGTKFEEVPGVANGQASMVVKPYTKNQLGGSLNLIAAVLAEGYEKYESAEGSETDIKNRIRQAVQNISGV